MIAILFISSLLKIAATQTQFTGQVTMSYPNEFLDLHSENLDPYNIELNH